MLNEHKDVTVDLWQIIAHYGYDHQKGKAIEELGELATALARDLQGDKNRANIAEEMADVYVIFAQLELIYGNHTEVVAQVQLKLARTLAIVERERKGEGCDKG